MAEPEYAVGYRVPEEEKVTSLLDLIQAMSRPIQLAKSEVNKPDWTIRQQILNGNVEHDHPR